VEEATYTTLAGSRAVPITCLNAMGKREVFWSCRISNPDFSVTRPTDQLLPYGLTCLCRKRKGSTLRKNEVKKRDQKSEREKDRKTDQKIKSIYKKQEVKL
jgi:hypothetical protein